MFGELTVRPVKNGLKALVGLSRHGMNTVLFYSVRRWLACPGMGWMQFFLFCKGLVGLSRHGMNTVFSYSVRRWLACPGMCCKGRLQYLLQQCHYRQQDHRFHRHQLKVHHYRLRQRPQEVRCVCLFRFCHDNFVIGWFSFFFVRSVSFRRDFNHRKAKWFHFILSLLQETLPFVLYFPAPTPLPRVPLNNLFPWSVRCVLVFG